MNCTFERGRGCPYTIRNVNILIYLSLIGMEPDTSLSIPLQYRNEMLQISSAIFFLAKLYEILANMPTWPQLIAWKVMLKKTKQGFPGGAVVETPPANAGDTGSSPGLGRSHMSRSNEAREPQLLSLRVWSLCSATGEAATVRVHAPR